ncbi:uncharacterized protein G2W53_038419 [Senna tora]|uniref:Uncharacterized protein n=1 Tax=Senna tora TaxID=362788 RepID=A0A834SL28_9FABA|nr:uncharacterized protein G2W53_038419 [Senna tora]
MFLEPRRFDDTAFGKNKARCLLRYLQEKRACTELARLRQQVLTN